MILYFLLQCFDNQQGKQSFEEKKCLFHFFSNRHFLDSAQLKEAPVDKFESAKSKMKNFFLSVQKKFGTKMLFLHFSFGGGGGGAGKYDLPQVIWEICLASGHLNKFLWHLLKTIPL